MRKIFKNDIWSGVHAVTDFRAETSETARFQAGDTIVVRNINPTGHTRLPRFVRGRTGTVQQRRGSFVFPDSMAHGLGPKPQHLYSVRFAARDLWGSAAAVNDYVYLDLWDDYIGGAVETTHHG